MSTINSQINRVIVYRNGARITRSAKTEIKTGKQEIILDNLTANISQGSLQVKLKGKALLLSASVRHSYLDYTILPEKTKKLEESLKKTVNEIEWLNSEQEIYHGEASLIHDNQVIINKKTKVSAEDIEKLANFYQERLFMLRKNMHENNLKLRNLEEKKNHIELQIENIQGQPGKQTGQIILNVLAKENTTIEIGFSYLTTNASWTPFYDIRSDGTEKEIELLYKASIVQGTGYDWKDIDLVISTGNPTENNEHPVLSPWYIGFYSPQKQEPNSPRMKAMAASESIMPEGIDDELEQRKMESLPFEVSLVESQMATEFQIDTKQDVPSDGQHHIVPISIYNLPVLYKHYIVPKLEQHAFLLAKIEEYNEHDLLPGDTNLFYDGMFIGQVYLDTRSTQDTLVVSMGRDERIGVQHVKITDKTSRKIISTAQKEIKGYEITIRNNKPQPIELEVLDQVPLSNHKDIVIEIEESSGADYDEESGILVWNIALDAGETKKIRFIYAIKYPKDKQLSGF